MASDKTLVLAQLPIYEQAVIWPLMPFWWPNHFPSYNMTTDNLVNSPVILVQKPPPPQYTVQNWSSHFVSGTPNPTWSHFLHPSINQPDMCRIAEYECRTCYQTWTQIIHPCGMRVQWPACGRRWLLEGSPRKGKLCRACFQRACEFTYTGGDMEAYWSSSLWED